MRISISNIAWDISEDELVVDLLKKYEIDAIDIAPGKYFVDPLNTSQEDIRGVRDWWGSYGIEIIGMQSLLFGTKGLNLFGSYRTQSAMLKYLEAVCRIGKNLGATKLVFGSPKNRDRLRLSPKRANDIAIQFFNQLGGIAESYGVTICLEPNPTCYGANFMTNSIDTAAVVEEVAHSCVRMQFDTGAININKERADLIIEKYAGLIGHIHASEPGLITLGDADTDHSSIGLKLKDLTPKQIVTIEMLPSKKESNIIAIERALKIAIEHYRANLEQDCGANT
jgi:sugar phosphate isomerase/epimerase